MGKGFLGNYISGWMGGKVAKMFGGDERLGQLAGMSASQGSGEGPTRSSGEGSVFLELLTPIYKYDDDSTLFSFALSHWTFWLASLGTIWGFFLMGAWAGLVAYTYWFRSLNLLFLIIMLAYGIYRAFVEFVEAPRIRQILLPIFGALGLIAIYLLITLVGYVARLTLDSSPAHGIYAKPSLGGFAVFCCPALVTRVPFGLAHVYGLSENYGWDPGVQGFTTDEMVPVKKAPAPSAQVPSTAQSQGIEGAQPQGAPAEMRRKTTFEEHQEKVAQDRAWGLEARYRDEYWEMVNRRENTQEDNEAYNRLSEEGWDAVKDTEHVKRLLAKVQAVRDARKKPWWYFE